VLEEGVSDVLEGGVSYVLEGGDSHVLDGGVSDGLEGGVSCVLEGGVSYVLEGGVFYVPTWPAAQARPASKVSLDVYARCRRRICSATIGVSHRPLLPSPQEHLAHKQQPPPLGPL